MFNYINCVIVPCLSTSRDDYRVSSRLATMFYEFCFSLIHENTLRVERRRVEDKLHLDCPLSVIVHA